MDPELREAQVALGHRLRDLRKAAGLTQDQLAAASLTSRSSIASIETGRQNPDSGFWQRADKAVQADGVLIAEYEDLRSLARQKARDAIVSCHPRSQGDREPGVRTVLMPGHPDAVWTGYPAARVIPQQWPAGGPGHGLAGPARPGSGPAERSLELLVRAHALLAANDRREVEAAKVLLDRAVMREPSFAQAIAARGYANWRQYFAGWAKHSQALASAMRDVQSALAADPDSVWAHLAFVRVCWDMGWHESALAAGRLVFCRHPESLNAALAFARALNNAGLAQFALPLVDSILTADPTNPAALRLRIWCHLMVGNFGHAVEAATGYLPAHPGDANTRWAAALAYRYLGDDAGALRAVEDATAADPGDITVWVLLGYLRRDLLGESDAIEGWKAGLAHADGQEITSSRARAWLANLYAAIGDEQKALGIVDDLRSCEPGNGYLGYRLAHVLAELGRDDQAAEMLDHAVACGFLSVQLAHREESLATARISGSGRYRDTMRRLEQKVAACAVTYAPDILPVPVAATASARWST
jgi:tetratricopeptide (TPR) repeat protein